MSVAGGRHRSSQIAASGSRSPNRQPSPAASHIPFDEIRSHAVPVIEALARRWLPNGARAGQWWVCQVPWREDKQPSFGLSMTTARWQDFAQGDKGDVFDLYVRLYGGTLADAARQVARAVGHRFGDSQ